MSAQDIQFWQIRKRSNRRKPWEVRWRVGTSSFSRSFLTKALGETYRADLFAAAKSGERFSLVTGEPVNWELSAETLYAHVRAYVGLRWNDGGAANSRKVLSTYMVCAVLAFLDPRKAGKGRPDGRLLRRALREWAFRPSTWDGEPPEDVAAALAWVAGASRPVADLAEAENLRGMLDALFQRLDGKPLAPTSVRGRRATLYGCLDYAVERKLLSTNPLNGLKVRRRRVSDRVDPRRVPSLAQARRLLGALADREGIDGHLHAWFSIAYYAGCRPAEIRDLREADCFLPDAGWGRLTLAGSAPEVGGGWTDHGERFDPRELKHRARGEVRMVPLPPLLVGILRDHLKRYGTAPDGRLFWDVTADGHAYIDGQRYRRSWDRARTAVLSETEYASALAKRPYDLRHGNASWLLGLGVPATEVARRLGHSVAMLHTTYAHWLEGQEEAANTAIDRALTAADEQDGDGPATGHIGETASE